MSLKKAMPKMYAVKQRRIVDANEVVVFFEHIDVWEDWWDEFCDNVDYDYPVNHGAEFTLGDVLTKSALWQPGAHVSLVV